MSKEKSCRTCGFFAELKEPFERSDGAVIYGYCFKDGDKDYSPNMGKGYPVFVDGGGGACKQYKRRRAALREQLTTNCHQLEPVTNRNGLNGIESDTVKGVEIDQVKWISVEDRLPEVEKEVQVLCKASWNSKYLYQCHAFYVPKGMLREASYYGWDYECCDEYSEEDDDYFVNPGWYERIHNWDDYNAVGIADDVTHWMPLPEPPEVKV